MVDTFLFFSYFSRLKPNLTKSKIAAIGALREVQVTVCDMCCIDLNNDSLKILGTQFSRIKNYKRKKSFVKL